MSGGLVALLDDIATLAKVTASSIDDVAANAVKASSKAVGVVIDDTAVTPQYVSGLSPERELPIIAKIARGSLINKLFIIRGPQGEGCCLRRGTRKEHRVLRNPHRPDPQRRNHARLHGQPVE